MITTRRDPIGGGFKVLVVPAGDVRLTESGLTIPLTMEQTGACFRVVGNAEKGDVGCSSWAFTRSSRKTVCKNLRNLADWIEKNAVAD
jgi:hypothetical protein